MRFSLTLILILISLTACEINEDLTDNSGGGDNNATTARVTRVIDGDTIDVELNGESVRIRYVGVNTPERDEPCYSDATQANRDLVEGQTVRLEIDTSDTDRFDRLLRYVYVGDTFVNEELIRRGYGEVVRYAPDDREFANFRTLEQAAASNNAGCHPTGIFNDGNFDR